MSNPYRTVIHENGKAIRFQIKRVFGAAFLVINTNFKPLDFKGLIECDFLSIEGVNRLDSLGIYLDGTGYVIYFLNKRYDDFEILTNIETTFITYFDGNN